ncbi:hypothetical protein HPGCJGGD_3741 [Methylobacterium haplocladii]|nr:hypothetical protein HPGCJGGD_3741 [Methylobacterium haplocladii]
MPALPASARDWEEACAAETVITAVSLAIRGFVFGDGGRIVYLPTLLPSAFGVVMTESSRSVRPPSSLTAPPSAAETEALMPCTNRPSKRLSVLAMVWLMTAELPLASRATTSPLTSPATLKVSLPRPPMRVVTTPAGVDRT